MLQHVPVIQHKPTQNFKGFEFERWVFWNTFALYISVESLYLFHLLLHFYSPDASTSWSCCPDIQMFVWSWMQGCESQHDTFIVDDDFAKHGNTMQTSVHHDSKIVIFIDFPIDLILCVQIMHVKARFLHCPFVTSFSGRRRIVHWQWIISAESLTSLQLSRCHTASACLSSLSKIFTIRV